MESMGSRLIHVDDSWSSTKQWLLSVDLRPRRRNSSIMRVAYERLRMHHRALSQLLLLLRRVLGRMRKLMVFLRRSDFLRHEHLVLQLVVHGLELMELSPLLIELLTDVNSLSLECLTVIGGDTEFLFHSIDSLLGFMDDCLCLSLQLAIDFSEGLVDHA